MERGAVEVLISRNVVAEWREVLGRPEIRSASAALTDRVVNAFLERLLFRATLVRPVRHRFDYPRDPKDEPYIDLCLAGRADYLVTRERICWRSGATIRPSRNGSDRSPIHCGLLSRSRSWI